MNLTGPISNTAASASLTFFKDKYPYYSKLEYTPAEWQFIERRFTAWKAFTIFLVFFYMFALPLPIGWLLYMLYKGVYSLLHTGGETFYPVTIHFFMLPGITLGLATMGYFIEGTQKLLIGRNYKVFEDYYNHKQGYDNHKAMMLIVRIFLVASAFAIAYCFSTRLVLKEQNLVYKGLTGVMAKEYSYSDVKSIVFTQKAEDKKGEIYEANFYEVQLKDGMEINCGFYFNGADKSLPFIQELSKRTSLPVDTIPFLPYQ